MPDMPDVVTHPMLWGQLGACLLVIGIASCWLSRFGSVIGERSGMSGSWIGFTLLAGARALPRLITSVSALRWGTRTGRDLGRRAPGPCGMPNGNLLGANLLMWRCSAWGT